MITYEDFLTIGKKYGLFWLKKDNNAYFFYDKNDTSYCMVHYNLTLKKCWVGFDIRFYEHNHYVPSDVKEIHTNEDLIEGIAKYLYECKKVKSEYELSKIKQDFDD